MPLGPPRRAGVGHWDGDVRCVSVDPVLHGYVWPIDVGGVHYAPKDILSGFRALKKTPEAPYPTKVNYR